MKKIIFLLLFFSSMLLSMEQELPDWVNEGFAGLRRTTVHHGIFATPKLNDLCVDGSCLDQILNPFIDYGEVEKMLLRERNNRKRDEYARGFFIQLDRFLINGGNPNSLNRKMRPLISAAISKHNREAFELLLMHPDINVNIADEKGLTPLHHAARVFDPGMVKLLMIRGANPLIFSRDGRLPIDFISNGGTSGEALKDLFIARMAVLSRLR